MGGLGRCSSSTMFHQTRPPAGAVEKCVKLVLTIELNTVNILIMVHYKRSQDKYEYECNSSFYVKGL